jgi:hypothetical protein
LYASGFSPGLVGLGLLAPGSGAKVLHVSTFSPGLVGNRLRRSWPAAPTLSVMPFPSGGAVAGLGRRPPAVVLRRANETVLADNARPDLSRARRTHEGRRIEVDETHSCSFARLLRR